MCGICGIVWDDAQRPSPSGLLQRMTDRLEHRGPDGSGYFEQPGVSLGHRRLSIIDLAGGTQPLANEDETVWVTFNGEIYNFHELTDLLQAKGHVFKTRSDTEVLVHLYEEYGPEMVTRLRGMFAFAIWDAKDRTLLLARDRLGQKPLVYWHNASGLHFASELKALLADPAFPKEMDNTALDHYLAYQYIPHPRTIYKAARKLPPAHFAVYKDGTLTLHRYWKPDYETEVVRSEADYINELRQTLTEATRLRMISDVPLGAFLSGGIDSTIVVGLMRQVSNAPVKTFSIGFPIKEFDETSYARMAARHLQTDHEEFIVEPDAVDVVSKLAWFYDEPFSDSSAVPTYYVSKMTRQRVTVALTGDAGDELFCGYLRYQATQIGQWFDRLPRPLRSLITARLWQRIPASAKQKSKLRRLKKLTAILAQTPETRYRHWVSIFDDAARADLYTDSFASQLNEEPASDFLDRLYAELPGRDFMTRTMYVDLLSYLPVDLLTKVDIASMANSLECRGPFLDHHVVAVAGRMPLSLKLRGTTKKYILKKAFPDLLVPEIQKRAKMGFGVPIDHWLRKELAPMTQDLLLSPTFTQRGWFKPDAVARLVHDHIEGRWDHSYRLWSLMMLELWARTYLDAPQT